MARTQDKTKDGQRGTGRFWRYAWILTLAGVVLLAWVSLLTYSPQDLDKWQVSSNAQVHNAAGTVGAHFAYYLLHYVGGGVYAALVMGSVASVILVLGGRIDDLPWRIVGVALLTAAISTGIALKAPDRATDLDNYPAGALGAAAGHLLTAKLHSYSWAIVALVFVGGLLFSAEKVMAALPKLLLKAWQGRGTAAQAGRSLGDVLAGLLPKWEKKPAAAKPAKPAPAAKPDKPGKPAKPAPAVVADDAEEQDDEPAPAPAPLPEPFVEKPPLGPSLPAFRLTEPSALKPKPVKPKPSAPRKHTLPAIDLLEAPTGGYSEVQKATAAAKQVVLQQTLTNFNVEATVVGHMTGPVITMYELSLSPGVKVSQVASLANDIARSLAVPGVRIVSPIPGKDTVGIEVPNLDKEMVRIRELMTMAPEAETSQFLPLYLGKDAGGGAIVADLARMPHMLIAGTTGSGKSVCINTIIMSLLMTKTPADVKFILVDPKMVEMAAFENIPHLLCPIVNDMRKAEDILEWAATKMDERYELLKEAGVRNIAGFNRLTEAELYERFQVESDEEKARIPKQLPYYVIIIDELADLMMTSSKEVESYIIRIAQKARAVGIHLVLATQRPSVNVVTGLIKSNMPCRISFRVASRQESRIVLDQNGADVLLGQGDMLFLQPGTSNLIRAQGTFIDDGEIRKIVNELKKNGGEPEFNPELVKLQSGAAGEVSGEKDDLFDQAVEIVLATSRGSVSLLQRRLQIGYSRASRIIDQMAEAGLLGEYKGSQARECMITLEDWQQMKASIAADQSGASSLDGEPTSA